MLCAPAGKASEFEADCNITPLSNNERTTSEFNFRFNQITLDVALQLLAEAAGLRYRRPKNVDWSYKVDTEYSATPWNDIVNGICNSEKLRCWVEEDILYAMPESDPGHIRLAGRSCSTN